LHVDYKLRSDAPENALARTHLNNWRTKWNLQMFRCLVERTCVWAFCLCYFFI